MTRFISNTVGEPDANPMHVPESVIQDVWGRQRFDLDGLTTTEGIPVMVQNPGRLNSDQGPDFVNATIILNRVKWSGSVEIHRCSGDWFRHGHETDPVYNNVILHATLIADRQTGKLRRQDGSLVPEIVLFPRLEAPLRTLSWDSAVEAHRDFPCKRFWPRVPDDVLTPFLDDVVRSRFERKSERVSRRLEEEPEPDQVLYEETFRALGYAVNSETMVILARRVPLSLLRELDSPFDGFSLLIGTSGLLPGPPEYLASDPTAVEFAMAVAERYRDLESGLGIPRLPRQVWRFSRMRPANFPSLRIAQATALFARAGPMAEAPLDLVLAGLTSSRPFSTFETLLSAEPDPFWREHANLKKRLPEPRSACIGSDRRVAVISNAFLPVVLAVKPDADWRNGVHQCLARLPPRFDRVTRRYSGRGRPTSEGVSQALHELSKSWCSTGRCLECPVGRYLSRRGCRFA